MDRNDRNILILGILILVVLAVAYYFLLFSPLRQDYLAKYDERTRREAQKQQLEQTAAQLENIRRNAADIERQILELSKRIPEQAELPTLVVQIEEVAEAAEVTQFSIEPGAPEAPPGGGNFSRIPITMTFVGRYEQMQDFLLRVRNLARLVTVNEVTYCRSPEPISDANCPAQIEQGGGETTGEGTTREGTTRQGTARANNDVESLLEVQVVAEVYVQPPAGGEETTAAAPPLAPAGGGDAKGKAGAKGGGAAK
ncbi:MAG: type 4a pilus biogenesis protein PilO [Actinomycetota bacterium]|nr:type 4a pilus biogenesis protein PilO [Actinomycetota bacterium]